LLRIENISKSFGGLRALRKVSFTVEKGIIAALIGPNGAGKTTLFNVINGFIHPDSGRVIFLDKDITKKSVQEINRAGIARTFQKFNVFPRLSIFENIYAGTLKEKGKNRKEREEKVQEILELLGLSEKANRRISEVSILDVKLTELGAALATNPKLLLLDELVAGLTGEEANQLCNILKYLNRKGYTILQIGHEMGPIMSTSNWIYVLDNGVLIAEGPPEKVRDDEKVQEVYLETGVR
jgi:branched-chain amino acid transport system ATP-binding protein